MTLRTPPLPARYWEDRLARLCAELEAIRTELDAAVSMMPPKLRERYTREREERGGVMP